VTGSGTGTHSSILLAQQLAAAAAAACTLLQVAAWLLIWQRCQQLLQLAQRTRQLLLQGLLQLRVVLLPHTSSSVPVAAAGQSQSVTDVDLGPG
jgi:predicted membrane protein